jgi:hypothetical protein
MVSYLIFSFVSTILWLAAVSVTRTTKAGNVITLIVSTDDVNEFALVQSGRDQTVN